jgi:hypothetical protein
MHPSTHLRAGRGRADFPACAGWTCIADDTSTEDQRCDSVRLRALITSEITDMAIKAATLKSPAQLFAASNRPSIQKKLRKAICKFPSEFDQGTFERRYGHIQQEVYFQENPGSWDKLKAHIQALTCTDLPAAYKNAQWHFHPLAFIEHMRKCMWLSKQELVQLITSHAVRSGQWKDAQGNRHAGVFWEKVRVADTESDESIIAKHRTSINRTMRKYGITTPLRQASFLSNAIQESGWLARLQELGGEGYWYTPWHGRGLLQLTHPGNYFKYWEWRGQLIPKSLKTAMLTASQAEANKAPNLRSKAAMHDDSELHHRHRERRDTPDSLRCGHQRQGFANVRRALHECARQAQRIPGQDRRPGVCRRHGLALPQQRRSAPLENTTALQRHAQ